MRDEDMSSGEGSEVTRIPRSIERIEKKEHGKTISGKDGKTNQRLAIQAADISTRQEKKLHHKKQRLC